MRNNTYFTQKNNELPLNLANSTRENQRIQNKHVSTTNNATMNNQDNEIPQSSFHFGKNFLLLSQKITQKASQQTDLDLSFCQTTKFKHSEVLLNSFDKYINQSGLKNFSKEKYEFFKYDLREQIYQFQQECLETIKKKITNQDFAKIKSMIRTIHHKTDYLHLFNFILKFIPINLASSLFILVQQLFIFFENCIKKLKSHTVLNEQKQIERYLNQNQQKLITRLQNRIQLEELFPACIRSLLKSQFQQFIGVWNYSFCMCLYGYFQNKYFVQDQEGKEEQLFDFSDDNFWCQDQERKPSKKVKRNIDQ